MTKCNKNISIQRVCVYNEKKEAQPFAMHSCKSIVFCRDASCLYDTRYEILSLKKS